MPSSSLRSALDSLAASFTRGLLAAIRTASIEELTGGQTTRGKGRPAAHGGGGQPKPLSVPVSRGKRSNGRLARRSPEQLQAVLAKVVGVVRQTTGMRAEEIQKRLRMDRRELPRVLKLGLETKKLRKKGVQRSTMYSVA